MGSRGNRKGTLTLTVANGDDLRMVKRNQTLNSILHMGWPCKQGWFLCTTPTKCCHSNNEDARAKELQTFECDFHTNPLK